MRFYTIKFNFRANALELKLSHCNVFNTVLNLVFDASPSSALNFNFPFKTFLVRQTYAISEMKISDGGISDTELGKQQRVERPVKIKNYKTFNR